MSLVPTYPGEMRIFALYAFLLCCVAATSLHLPPQSQQTHHHGQARVGQDAPSPRPSGDNRLKFSPIPESTENLSNNHRHLSEDVLKMERYLNYHPVYYDEMVQMRATDGPVSGQAPTTSPKLRVCYYQGPGANNLTVDRINVSLCTHLNYAFVAYTDDGGIGPRNQEDVEVWRQLMALKKQNPSLKIMASSGGGEDAGYHHVLASQDNMTTYVRSSIKFLRKYEFDGLDLDWEYPAWDLSYAYEKQAFSQLVKMFDQAARNESKTSGKPKLLLTAAVGAMALLIDVSYEIPILAKYLDFVNLMTYDYHYFMESLPLTGHNSPLFKRKSEPIFINTMNTAWTVNAWISQGLPREKAVVGIPIFTNTYSLLNPADHDFYSPATGYGNPKSMEYVDICRYEKRSDMTRVFDKESQVPYIYGGKFWAGIDDSESITIKSKWIRDNNLGGAMTWSLNLDDIAGVCDGSTKFPMHSILYNILK